MRLAAGAHGLQHGESVLPGEADVQQQQVEVLVAGQRLDLDPVVADRGLVPSRPQTLGEEARQARLVFGYQDAAHRSSGQHGR